MTKPASGYLVAGRYRLSYPISSGGMGTVWLARDELLGRAVALKEVLAQPGATADEAEEQRQRSLREGRIAARLTHPHVIAVYDVALDGGDPWLVMEYLPSRSLAAVLKSTGPLPVDDVRRIGAQLSDALAAAHAAGIVHRDVKPGNVLIADGERGQATVKITDFGISHAYGDVTLTQTGILHGTPAYLAPEVARGGEPTEASDVFSLGATLYTAVEGTLPFGPGDNSIALLHRVARGEIAPPQRAGTLTPTLLRMLEPNPAYRLSMSQARDALSSTEGGYEQTRARPASLPPPTQPPATRPPATRPQRRSMTGGIAAGLVGLVLLLAAVVGFIVVNNNRHSSSPTVAAAPTTTLPVTPVPTTTAPTTSAAATTTSTTTTSTTTTSTATTSAPTTTAQTRLTEASATTAVQNYYALLPADPATAWTRLGPTLKAQGFDAYDAFWNSFARVTAKDASSSDGGTTVQVTVVFDRGNGPATTETHRLTMLPGDSGPLIDSDTLLSSRTGN